MPTNTAPGKYTWLNCAACTIAGCIRLIPGGSSTITSGEVSTDRDEQTDVAPGHHGPEFSDVQAKAIAERIAKETGRKQQCSEGWQGNSMSLPQLTVVQGWMNGFPDGTVYAVFFTSMATTAHWVCARKVGGTIRYLDYQADTADGQIQESAYPCSPHGKTNQPPNQYVKAPSDSNSLAVAFPP